MMTPPPPATTKFEGTWNNIDNDYHYIFTGTDVMMTYQDTYHRKGSFTFTATEITLNYTHLYDGDTWQEMPHTTVYTYTLSGNTLTLSNYAGTYTYTRQ